MRETQYQWINRNKFNRVSCSEFIGAMENRASKRRSFNAQKKYADFYYKLQEKYGFFPTSRDKNTRPIRT